jgi:predicted MFS family arabinose efflux permease
MNPPIWLMAFTAFTVGCGMRLLDPLLPMLAREFGVGLGAVAPLIGGFALAYGVGQVAIGPLGDRFGKMRVVAIGMTFYAAAVLASGMAGDLGALLTFRVLAGLACAAVMPLFMAQIGDTVPYGQRQAALGQLLNGMVAAQLLAGPLSGAIADHAGWRSVFLLIGVLAFASTALFVAMLGRPLWQAPAAASRGVGLGGFLRILEKPAGRRLMLGTGLDGMLLFGGAFPFLASLLIERFGLSAAEAGLVTASFGLGSLVYTQTAGRLLARLGERGMVMVGGLGVALALAVFALSPVWWAVAVAQALVGLLFFMLHGVLQARATELLPEARGTAVACFAMSLFLGQSIGAVVFGAVIVLAGFTPAFLGAALAVVALSLWLKAGLLKPA